MLKNKRSMSIYLVNKFVIHSCLSLRTSYKWKSNHHHHIDKVTHFNLLDSICFCIQKSIVFFSYLVIYTMKLTVYSCLSRNRPKHCASYRASIIGKMYHISLSLSSVLIYYKRCYRDGIYCREKSCKIYADHKFGAVKAEFPN